MNKLVIPPSPNWYEPDIMACSPDNTLLYGCRQEIVVIKHTSESEPDNIQVIHKAHSAKISSINLNRNWGQPYKYAVSTGEDKIVKCWDVETMERKVAHNQHLLHNPNSKLVGASFAGDDRVVSVQENGTVVIWNIVKQETNLLSSLFENKVIITCLSVCPHATWLAAFGLKSGLIIVADLRRNGNILYKLRGHDKAVVSLSWCPAPINIFPIKPYNKVVELKKYTNNLTSGDAESVIDTDKFDSKNLIDNKDLSSDIIDKINKRKQQKPKKYEGDVSKYESLLTSESDFLKECRELKQDILNLSHSKQTSNSEVKEVPESGLTTKTNDGSRVMLQAKRKVGKSTLAERLFKISSKKDNENVDLEKDSEEKEKRLDTEIEGKISNSENQTCLKNIEGLGNSEERTENSSEGSNKTNKKEPNIDDLQVLMENVRVQDKVDKSADDINVTSEISHFFDNKTNTQPTLIDHSVVSLEDKKDQMEMTDILKQIQDPGSSSTPNEIGQRSSDDALDTPTDRNVVSMEISHSVNKKANVGPDLTTNSVVSMEITECVNVTTSSESSHLFSSASSCCNDLNCSKTRKENLELEFQQTSDTSASSEKSDVFHDANCEDDSNKDSCSEKSKDKESMEVVKSEEPPAGVDEEPRKEFLLASSAREPNIYIWRAGTDGRMQTFLTVPPKKYKSKVEKEKMFIIVCWVAPHTLLSSSRNAELLHWTLPKPIVQGKYMRQIHKDHWSVLFSIKAPIVYLTEENFTQKNEIQAWTTGMDRQIFNTDCGSLKNLACYPALGGSVNCMSGSPLDPNRLAIGTGDAIVNIWDLGRDNKKQIVFSVFYQKILSPVTALAWHPINETFLAWGTTEGRVGVLDAVSKSKPSKILPHYFKSTIHKLEWGPLQGDTTNMGLYVVSEGKVAVFDVKNPQNDQEILEMPDNNHAYTFAWKPDHSMLLVSSSKGALISYTKDLKISNISYVPNKMQSLVWHPDAVSEDQTASKYCQTIVSLIKSNEIIVFNVDTKNENFDDKVISRFENKSLINSIVWSPHCGNHLVFTDDEGVAQVFDIESSAILSTYINPSLAPISCVYWSPLDSDYIIIGSVAHSIVIWKTSENPPLTAKEINSTRNKITKSHPKEVWDLLAKDKVKEEQSVVCKKDEDAKPKKTNKSLILPQFYSVRESNQIQDIRKLLKWKLEEVNVESNIGDTNTIDVLDLFGTNQKGTERILDLNVASLQQQGKYHYSNMLYLFKGDISTAVKAAIDQKRVTPWIISLSPMVSPKLWQVACETYANQLLEEPGADPFETVTYLLACHKVTEAVDTLCEKGLFREALVLAKARLVETSVVSSVLDKWAKNMMHQGNFEFAAQSYIALGKFEDAASVLFRRSNIHLLELAVELAKLSENEELYKAVTFRFNAFKAELEKIEAEKNNKNGECLSQKEGKNSNFLNEEKVSDKKSESIKDEITLCDVSEISAVKKKCDEAKLKIKNEEINSSTQEDLIESKIKGENKVSDTLENKNNKEDSTSHNPENLSSELDKDLEQVENKKDVTNSDFSNTEPKNNEKIEG